MYISVSINILRSVRSGMQLYSVKILSHAALSRTVSAIQVISMLDMRGHVCTGPDIWCEVVTELCHVTRDTA